MREHNSLKFKELMLMVVLVAAKFMMVAAKVVMMAVVAVVYDKINYGDKIGQKQWKINEKQWKLAKFTKNYKI